MIIPTYAISFGFTVRNFTVNFASCVVIGNMVEYRELLIVHRAYTFILSLQFSYTHPGVCVWTCESQLNIWHMPQLFTL